MGTASNDFFLHKVLSIKHGSSDRLADMFIQELKERGEVRNMCAKVHPRLVQNVERVCKTIGVSQRAFIESAVIHAVEEVDGLIDEHLKPLMDEVESNEHDQA